MSITDHDRDESLQSRYITMDEVRVTVDFAAWARIKTDTWWQLALLQPGLFLIESGRFEARTSEGSFVAPAGSLVCVRPTPRYVYGIHAPGMIWAVSLRLAPPPQQRLIPWLPEVGPAPLHMPLGAAFEQAHRLFQTICTELPRSTLAEQTRVRAAVFELLAIMQQTARSGTAEDGCAVPVRSSVKKMDIWQRARLRLESDLRRPLSIEQIARELKVTPDYFTRQFRRRFNISPHACRTRAKLREAMKMLRRGDNDSAQPIKAVAYNLGFRDPHAFARLFKRHMGVNPSQVTGGGGDPTCSETGPPAEMTPGVTHILPADRDSIAPFDALTEIVASAPLPFTPASIIYQRKG